MKIVLDTSIRPSCYSYTTRTVCHENRAGHKYPFIVTVTRHAQCVMKIVQDTSIRPSCYCYTTRTVCVMKIVLDTSIRPSCYCYTTRTVCVMKIELDTSIRPSCYCYTTRTVWHENRAGHKYPSIVLLLHDTHSVS